MNTLRARLLTVTALTLASGMAVLCLAGNVLVGHTIDSDIHQRLDARLEAVVSSLSVRSDGEISVNDTLNDSALDIESWIIDPSGRLIEQPGGTARGLTPRVLALASASRAQTRQAPAQTLLGSRVVRVGPRRVATVVAGVSVAQFTGLRREILFGSIAVALLTLLVGVLAIRRALDAALAPVTKMTADAEEWGAHDLDRRFGLGAPANEITALAAMLDHLLERIASSRRHEQRFASEIAHELRTPLAAIRGVAELAADAPDVEQAREALSQIHSHSGRIATTLDTLIAFARREVSLAADGVDLEQVAAGFEGVTVQLVDGPLPRVEGDPSLLHQTVAPLVDNARRHAASRVTIELSTADGRAVLTVRDDGPGVDPAVRTAVFLPGVQGEGQAGDGAGLGLPLALRLARSYGGELTLGDGPGGCFVLSLPALR